MFRSIKRIAPIVAHRPLLGKSIARRNFNDKYKTHRAQGTATLVVMEIAEDLTGRDVFTRLEFNNQLLASGVSIAVMMPIAYGLGFDMVTTVELTLAFVNFTYVVVIATFLMEIFVCFAITVSFLFFLITLVLFIFFGISPPK
jgi:hypothetical protein